MLSQTKLSWLAARWQETRERAHNCLCHRSCSPGAKLTLSLFKLFKAAIALAFPLVCLPRASTHSDLSRRDQIEEQSMYSSIRRSFIILNDPCDRHVQNEQFASFRQLLSFSLSLTLALAESHWLAGSVTGSCLSSSSASFSGVDFSVFSSNK